MTLTAAAVACCGATAAGVIDARTGFIPDRITRVTAVAAAACTLPDGAACAAFGGALLAGGVPALLYLATRGRGIGLGDVKLAAAIGAGLGPVGGIGALGAAFVLGGVYGSALLLLGSAQRSDALRFGPFLAAGAILALASRTAWAA